MKKSRTGKPGFREIRKSVQSGCLWKGLRFYVITLCGCYCLMDRFTTDPDYRIENPYGTCFFDKIICEMTKSPENLREIQKLGRRLELENRKGMQ